VRLQRVRPGSWWFDVALVAAFGLLTLLLAAKTPLLRVDLAVRDFADAHRPSGLYWTLRVFNYLGQGGQVLTPLAAIVAFVRAVRGRTVRPFLPVVAAFVLTYLTIGPLKLWTDRPGLQMYDGVMTNVTVPGLGGKTYGRLTVMLAAACRAEGLFRVGRGAFQPPPTVNNVPFTQGPLPQTRCSASASSRSRSLSPKACRARARSSRRRRAARAR